MPLLQLTFVADGGIRSKSCLLILGALELGKDSAGNVHAGDLVLLGELESESLGVVVHILRLGELQGHPALVAAGKSRLGSDTNGLLDLVLGLAG
jgi:hypothetical protein